jgi:flagellar basal body-associated protein FliL
MKKTDRLMRRDRGISLAVVILLVFVTMVLCFVAIAMWARRSELNAEKTRLLAVKRDEEAAALEIQKQQAEGVLPTGLPGGETGVPSVEEALNAVRDRRNEIFVKPGDPPAPESVTAFREERFGTFQALLTELSHRITLLMLRHQRVDLEARLAKVYVDAKTAARPEQMKAREDFKKKLTDQINDLNNRITEVTNTYNTNKATLQAQVDKLQGEIDLELAKFRDDERRETGKIRKMQHDLDQMRQKEVIKHRVNVAHGKVLRPDVAQKVAYIDLGSRDRVQPGLRFMAARTGREGKFEFKALLEVKKVWLDTSEVAIVRAYPGGGPVIDGDMIINPFYNPRRPVIVGFAGHKGDRAFNLKLAENNPKPLRFSAREAANRIKEIGSEARMDVTLDADFVLFTEVSDEHRSRDQWEDYKKAVLLEIPLADAAEYYEYLGG